MTTEEKITYATHLSRAGLLAMGAIKQSCIASVKVTTEVLRSLGILAQPMTASVMVMTDGWASRVAREQRLPRPGEFEAWWEEDGAYSLGIAYDPEPQESAWNAHLILLAAKRYLVDPSLDQCSRPERNLPLEPAVVDMTGLGELDIAKFRHGEDQAVSHWRTDDDRHGFVVVWSCFPDEHSYRESNDWILFRSRYGRLADSIVQTIREMDDLKLTGDRLPPLPPLPDARDDPELHTRLRDRDQKRLRMFLRRAP